MMRIAVIERLWSIDHYAMLLIWKLKVEIQNYKLILEIFHHLGKRNAILDSCRHILEMTHSHP